MSNRGQDGAQGFHTHGNVQKVTGIEEVVVVSEQRHQHVPNQVEEGLKDDTGLSVKPLSKEILSRPKLYHTVSLTHIVSEHNTELPDLVLDVNRCYPAERETSLFIAAFCDTNLFNCLCEE